MRGYPALTLIDATTASLAVAGDLALPPAQPGLRRYPALTLIDATANMAVAIPRGAVGPTGPGRTHRPQLGAAGNGAEAGGRPWSSSSLPQRAADLAPGWHDGPTRSGVGKR